MNNLTILEAKQAGQTWVEIGQLFNISSEAARKRAFRLRRKTGHYQPFAIPVAYEPPTAKTAAKPLAKTALTARQALQEYFGHVTRFTNYAIAEREARKIVAIGDLHGNPHPAMLAAVVNEQPDIVEIGGDLFNFHEANPHDNSPVDPANIIQCEAIRLRGAFDFLAKNLPFTVFNLLKGNHDDWVMRKAKELLAPYPYLLHYFHDPYTTLLAELPSRFVRIVNRWQYERHGIPLDEYAQTEYLHVLGDVLFSHANFTGANEGDGVRKLKTKFVDRWRGHLSGLDQVKVLVQFHGHKIAHLKQNGGSIHLIEPGMVAAPSTMAYQTEYNLKWSPGALGGVVLEQERIGDKWVTALDTVRLLNPSFYSPV